MKKKSVCMLTAAMAVSMAAGAVTAFISAPKAQAKAETLTTTVAKYDFSDPNDLGKDVSGNGNHLTVHSADGEEVPVQDTERGGVRFGGKSVLYAAGEREDKKGYDFADYLVNEKFTVSLDFWMDSTMDMNNKVYRPSIFALWGHMYTGNFDTNIGGSANNRASSLTMGGFDYPGGVPTPYLRFAWADGTAPDWGVGVSVTSDAWHTFTLSWDPATRTVKGTMDGNAYFTKQAMDGDTFVSNVARFTLGGYYIDPLNGGRGITSTDGTYCAFEGNIRNVTVTAEVASDYIVSATEVASAVTVTATATDDEIMAKAPAESDVTVTLLSGGTANAKAVWTGVERQGSDVYLTGNILAAGTSNLNGVKARMPVTVETIEETAAMLSYAFDNAVNPGASDKGGVFDLTANSGNVVVAGGYARCENAVLSAQADASGYDFMDYMNDFTMAVKFKLPIGIAQTHIPVVTVYGNGSEKQNSAVIVANAYEADSASTTLRMGFAYHSTDSSDGGGEDGFANAAYWSKYNAVISLGVWNTIAYSYRASDRMFTAYLNGNAVCAYEVAEEAVFAGKQCFTLGTTDGSVLYRALKIYDYVPSSENLAVLSDACVMPKGAETQAAENKVISATAASLFVETTELSGNAALKAVQKANKTVRAKVGDGEEKVNVFWDTATAQEDGSYKVTGLIFGAYNPDGVRAETIVSVKEYDITFTATNAAVKANGTSIEKMSVKYGADAQFTVEPSEGYTIKRVKAGDVELTAVNGVYTVACITEELSVTVETERVATDEENKNGENGEAAEEKKGCGSGCGSSLSAGACVCTALLAGVALTICRKRKNR